MPKQVRKPVVPLTMMPQVGMKEVKAQDGSSYLLRNDLMFTAMQHAQGEFSDFFLALRDEGKIFGHRCPECRHLIIPPFMKRCPACNFVEMNKEYVKDVGVMAATPVITIFAPSRFKAEVPFATGRVFLETSDGKLTDTAMFIRVRTTRGTMRPGIYKKGTAVKIAFLKKRNGESGDIFALPQSELSPAQLAKSPLLESKIDWGKFAEEELGEPDAQSRETLNQVVALFRSLSDMIPHSPRATANLTNWQRTVSVQTGGGNFSFQVIDGKLMVREEDAEKPDLILRLKDPAVLLAWLRDSTEGVQEGLESPPLTDLVMDGSLVVNKPELETITRLDRVPRSLRRDGVIKK